MTSKEVTTGTVDKKNEDLDQKYSPSCWSHRQLSPDEIIAKHEQVLKENSEFARSQYPTHIISYGPGKEQILEWIFPRDYPGGEAAIEQTKTAFVYFHGGYWQALNVASSTFMAPTMASLDITTVAVGYDLCPTVSMQQLVSQAKSGIQCILNMLPKNAHILLGGHSAGAHLVAEMLRYLTPTVQVRGLLLFSGIYDLRPLITTYINVALKLDFESSSFHSPLLTEFLTRDWPKIRILIICSEFDPPCFKENTSNMARKLELEGSSRLTEYIQENEDHFTLIESLSYPDSSISKRTLNWILQQL